MTSTSTLRAGPDAMYVGRSAKRAAQPADAGTTDHVLNRQDPARDSQPA